MTNVTDTRTDIEFLTIVNNDETVPCSVRSTWQWITGKIERTDPPCIAEAEYIWIQECGHTRLTCGAHLTEWLDKEFWCKECGTYEETWIVDHRPI